MGESSRDPALVGLGQFSWNSVKNPAKDKIGYYTWILLRTEWESADGILLRTNWDIVLGIQVRTEWDGMFKVTIYL